MQALIKTQIVPLNYGEKQLRAVSALLSKGYCIVGQSALTREPGNTYATLYTLVLVKKRTHA